MTNFVNTCLCNGLSVLFTHISSVLRGHNNNKETSRNVPLDLKGMPIWQEYWRILIP